jgi:predicted SAM-dependent methyltransferase
MVWINDQLPDLQKARSSGTLADLILLSAVWMHVAANNRTRAIRILIELLKPGGKSRDDLRRPPADSAKERAMYPTSSKEVERLCLDHAAKVLVNQANIVKGIQWTQIVVQSSSE